MDEWDRFPDVDASGSAAALPPAQPAAPPASSSGPGYSIEDGKLVVHIGGHKLRPVDDQYQPRTGSRVQPGGLPQLERMPDPEGAAYVREAIDRGKLESAGFDPNATVGSTVGRFATHDVPLAALGVVPGARVAGKAIAAAIPAAASLIPNTAAPADMPADPGSDAALNALRARQDAISKEMAKQTDIMSAKTPRPRGKGQPEANERSDPAFFAAKRAYDNLKVQFDEIGGQIGEEQTQRRERARRQQEGDVRVKEALENRSTFDKALDYAPTAGYVVGAGLGYMKGRSVAGQFTDKAKTLADDAASALQPNAGWNRRAGGVNEFFERGGAARGNVPFPAAPGETPPFRINPNAPEASSLYRQTPTSEAAAHAPWLMLGITDAAIGGYLEHAYGKEVIEAAKAMQADGSPANIARWEDAKRKEAFWGMMGNAGRGAVPVQMGTGAIPGLVGARARPPSGLADSERAAVDEWIRRTRGVPLPVGPAGPTPGLPAPQSQLALPPPVRPNAPGSPAPQPPKGGPGGAPAQPTASPVQPVESWKTPKGVIKKDSSGKWHDENGHWTGPPPKGSKRLSSLDSEEYYGGFA